MSDTSQTAGSRLSAASVAVPVGADMPAIAAAAGNADPRARLYAPHPETGEYRLFVVGVTQAALDAAATPSRMAGAPAPTPQAVTNFQARALMAATILPDGRSLEAAVNGMLRDALDATAGLPDADPARIQARTNWLAWEQSNEFTRGGALVTAIGAMLGYSAAELDAMFRDAAAIEA